MSTVKHPVAIIGAGFSGIISLKICLENGLDAIVYEKNRKFRRTLAISVSVKS